MFELSITNHHNSAFVKLPESKYGFSKDLHESISFTNPHIIISGSRFRKETGDYYENEDHVIVVVGKTFYRSAFSANLSSVNAAELLTQYKKHNEDFVNQLKGNFIIAIYTIKDNNLLVLKDTLGLKYFYHTCENNRFYLSTNLNDFKQITKKINYAAVIEKLIFTYPIGEESYLEDVFVLKEGGRLRINNGNLFKDTWTSINSLFAIDPLNKKIDKQAFLRIFEKNVLQRASVANIINASLTGGFDGRSNIAVLLNHKKKFHAYSFGKQGGENTVIPKQIAEKLGLDYEPIYLEENFEQNYAQCALDAIYYSDGISIFERANYIYALKKLPAHSLYNITGLIGGEIFSPVHQKTDYINTTYYNIIYLEMDFSIKALLLEKNIKKYINDDIIENKLTQQKITDNIEKRRKLVRDWKNEDFGWMYYLKDLISLGFRQFYGNQMHLERFYNENLTPFYDIDMIEYLFSTRHILRYRHAFKDSLFLRRNNRKMQTWIISRFSKELAAIPVDRGYPPIYTTDIRWLLIPFFFFMRRCKLKQSEPEFSSSSWCNLLYKVIKKDSFSFSSELLNSTNTIDAIEKYNSGCYSKNFNQALSIAIWLQQ